MAVYRTHEGFLGVQRCCLDRGADTDTDQERRAGIETIRSHTVHDKFHNTFIAFARHQHGRTAGKRAAAAGQVGVDLTLIRMGDDIPPDSRRPLADILACIVFIESLNRVVAKRRLKGRLNGGFAQQVFQFIDIRKCGAAAHPILRDTRILTGRALQLFSEPLISKHRAINDLRKRMVLFVAQFFQFRDHIIRQTDGGMSQKMSHDIGQFFYSSFHLDPPSISCQFFASQLTLLLYRKLSPLPLTVCSIVLFQIKINFRILKLASEKTILKRNEGSGFRLMGSGLWWQHSPYEEGGPRQRCSGAYVSVTMFADAFSILLICLSCRRYPIRPFGAPSP